MTTGSYAGIHAILYALFDRSEQLDRAAMHGRPSFASPPACTASARSA